jgi:hypothetical protein
MFPTAPRVDNKLMNILDTKSGVIFAERYLNKLREYLLKAKNVKIFQNS